MGFFTKYNGTTDIRLIRFERWAWTLIYGGLIGIVLGFFVGRVSGQSALAWYVCGALAFATGVALIYVRSTMRENKQETQK